MPSTAPFQQPAPAAIQAPTARLPLEALQTQVSELSQQLAGIRAERSVLSRRINSMAASGERVALENQKLALDVRITQTEMSLEAAKAQIGARVGVPPHMVTSTGTIETPRYNPRGGPDPDMIIGMSFVVIMAVVLPASIAYARRIWRGKPKDAPTAKADEAGQTRFDRLEQAVDAIAIEIERVAEGQRFVTRILAERPASHSPAPVASATISAPPSGSSPEVGLSEPKPFLALGAGSAPIEPIRVGMAERQAVRQSVTPH